MFVNDSLDKEIGDCLCHYWTNLRLYDRLGVLMVCHSISGLDHKLRTYALLRFLRELFSIERWVVFSY
jgi:hypothetical protein